MQSLAASRRFLQRCGYAAGLCIASFATRTPGHGSELQQRSACIVWRRCRLQQGEFKCTLCSYAESRGVKRGELSSHLLADKPTKFQIRTRTVVLSVSVTGIGSSVLI